MKKSIILIVCLSILTALFTHMSPISYAEDSTAIMYDGNAQSFLLLNEDETKVLSLSKNEYNNADYQWEIRVDEENGTWEELEGQSVSVIEVVYQTLKDIAGEDDTVQLRCRMTVNEEVSYSEVLDVELFENVFVTNTFGSDESSDDAEVVVETEDELTETDPEDDYQISTIEDEEILDGEEQPEEEEPEWMSWSSYDEFLAYQYGDVVWENPEFYIGLTAVFNTAFWNGFTLTDDPLSEGYMPTGNDEPISQTANQAENTINVDDKYIDENEFELVEDLKVVIDDVCMSEVDGGILWFKVSAAEGYTLPEELEKYPWVLQLYFPEDFVALSFVPTEGMFVGEKVAVQKELFAATRSVVLNTADLPSFFDVTPCFGDGFNFYDLGDITSWSSEITDSSYRYVFDSSVILIPAEVTSAYNRLMETTSSEMYTSVYASIPEDVLSMFSRKHIENAENYYEELVRLENIEINATTTVGDTPVEVKVKGKIPETANLVVTPVTNEAVMSEGFYLDSPEDIVVALDIKVMNNGVEWQPEEDNVVELSIDMLAFGYEEGDVFQLQHKHGDKVTKFDVFVVMDGKLTLRTSGFSIYLVNKIGDNDRSQGSSKVAENGRSFSLPVGTEKIYYFRISDTNNNNNINTGTWRVNDPTGSIYYTVHTNSTAVGNSGAYALWIKIVTLKETPVDDPIEITFDYARLVSSNGSYQASNTGSQTFYLTVTEPETTPGKVTLYLKDEVNNTGRITATVLGNDVNGVPYTLEGASFAWRRSDGLYIIPMAYENDYRSVNVARDHGGLVEARKNKTEPKYDNVTYYLDVVLADGTPCSASYTVYYQSEIINSSFEFPDATNSNYTYFTNGWPELYWKTTAPGLIQANGNYDKFNTLSMDIEYGDVTGGNDGGTNFGVTQASSGVQFAELNAEAVGALYQDIITVPFEDIEWQFSHAARPEQSWGNRTVYNKMYIVIGATEKAQALSNSELNELVRAAKTEANSDEYSWSSPVEITYKGGDYVVWYHDADTDPACSGNKWAILTGSYLVPQDQYRTRLFFVSDPDYNKNIVNAGNLIDSSSAGQYKSYLVEYYEESFTTVNGTTQKKIRYVGDKTETGNALVYSSVELLNYSYFLKENDFLHMVLINGDNYPYDIRKTVVNNNDQDEQKAYLYINKYEGKAVKPNICTEAEGYYENNNNYDDYDIVMQIFLRDTVIAVQKELVLPSSMSEEQKLTLMNDVNSKGGYISYFILRDVDENHDYSTVGHSTITERDPDGKYKGFISLGENPPVDHKYLVEELKTYSEEPDYDLDNQLVGLELNEVIITIVRYKDGVGLDEDDLVPKDYISTVLDANVPLVSSEFKLTSESVENNTMNVRIADVTITNYYTEKKTTFKYVAVGKGKVSLKNQDVYVDIPTEELDFYSGKSDGVKVSAGQGATFVGWYKDKECTEEILPIDGRVDDDGFFRPNPNVIASEEVTFYAKFVTSSIFINRTGANPNEVIVYHVKGKDGTDTAGVDMYVTVECDESGNGSLEISEVAKGEYTVTEVSEWAWRYPELGSQTDKFKTNDVSITFNFNGSSINNKWLNAISEIFRNVFGIAPSGGN